MTILKDNSKKLRELRSMEGYQADDLTEIKGIGERLSQDLNDYGVFNYYQIANWSADEKAAFGNLIAMEGRIDWDDWTGQAKNLHKKKYGN